MKKTIVIGAIVVLLGLGAYLGAGAFAASRDDAGAAEQARTGSTADPNQPDRTAEVKGIVISIDGTRVVIDRYLKDDTQELTDEEKAARRAERAQLTQEERQALKAAENAAFEKERVTVNVPVGTPVVQMVFQGDQPVAEPSTLAALRGGMEVTVWTDGGTDGSTAEYVKLASGK